MGQARIRKQSDPNYGKYKNNKRGIIVSSPTLIRPDGGVMIESTQLDKQDLRSSLLYWDKLSLPKIRNFYIAHGPETQELIDCRVLETPIIETPINGMSSSIMTAAQQVAFQKYEKSEPGVWSIGAGTNSLRHEDAKASTGTGIVLFNSLPVPSEGVPLVEILDFKERRRSELLMFRAHMDQMAAEITSSSDSEEALIKALIELDHDCANLITVTREWQYPVNLSNCKLLLNFDFAKSASAAAKAWRNAEDMGLGETEKIIATSIVGLSSHLKFSQAPQLQWIKRPASPYKYIYQATQELII